MYIVLCKIKHLPIYVGYIITVYYIHGAEEIPAALHTMMHTAQTWLESIASLDVEE